eukprot:TRINITY_DN2789_c0_g3_i2.p1 TRINITY_DN2789_c0_g3~~TRINITY_DN2789_c0_g3_i2.p1  ORF type:complete len:739 (-),score=49.00 TRINITY_DN2789_c0_g3_i2:206-2422(-)
MEVAKRDFVDEKKDFVSSEDQSPIEEVALVVPVTDDPAISVLTFRVWTLGTVSCVLLIFLNTFFSYRTQPLIISPILAQILVLPAGKLMAATLPKKTMRLPLLGEVSLNPGPFNMKEHVMITIFANCGYSAGGGDAYPTGAITVMKAYYKENISFLAALIIVLTTQIIGYGWAGLLRKYLVEPADMWWPSNLAQVSLFRALHEKDDTRKRRLSRMQFFTIFAIASFAYYTLPGYLFTVLTFFSWVCWVWPHSITAQQISSGLKGLGLGAFSFDWAGISAYHGSPLVTPWSSILNIAVGFVMFIYIIIPICYWKFNVFEARKFPIFSSDFFTETGQTYNTKKILTSDYRLDPKAYLSYSKLYLSPLFAISLGTGFARITSIVTHVILYHGRDILNRSRSAMSSIKLDVHARLMKQYKDVPDIWFFVLLIGSMVLGLVVSFVWKEVQLPWWGMVMAYALAWLLTLPLGVIQATTNQAPGYDIIAQYIYGYLYAERPIANLMFKIYGRISSAHALMFLADLKLGHYMKIPPRCMYIVQLLGTIVSAIVNLSVTWWMLEYVDNICDTDVLPANSDWQCPKYKVQFDASVIWGLVGPRRLFGRHGLYRNLVWLFLVGALLPVPFWILTKLFPKQKWLALINIPIISYGFAGMPPATPANIASWIITGLIFNYFVFKYRKEWWKRYNYVLSAALDCGTAFMGVLLYFAVEINHKSLNWWGTDDHCPLASCPTQPGIVVKGCPVF